MDDAVELVAQPETGSASRLMHIGEVADRVSLSHRTVRFYDGAGLLVPTRSSGNFRLFTEADVARLELIRTMKPLGFSLEEMGRLIALLDASAAGLTAEQGVALQELLLEAQRRRDKMADHLQAADLLLDRLRALG